MAKQILFEEEARQKVLGEENPGWCRESYPGTPGKKRNYREKIRLSCYHQRRGYGG